jgi:hypothetical protein
MGLPSILDEIERQFSKRCFYIILRGYVGFFPIKRTFAWGKGGVDTRLRAGRLGSRSLKGKAVGGLVKRQQHHHARDEPGLPPIDELIALLCVDHNFFVARRASRASENAQESPKSNANS